MTPHGHLLVPPEELRIGDLLYFLGHGHRIMAIESYRADPSCDLPTVGWRSAICEDDWRMTLLPGLWVEIAERPVP
jgi:hypothetical protein